MYDLFTVKYIVTISIFIQYMKNNEINFSNGLNDIEFLYNIIINIIYVENLYLNL